MLNESTIVTHRIIKVIPDNEDSDVLHFRTKGIAIAAAAILLLLSFIPELLLKDEKENDNIEN